MRIVTIALFTSLALWGQADVTRAKEESNKQVILKFLDPKTTPEERYELLHPDYLQHSALFKRFAEINGTRGREEFPELMQYNRSRPPAPPPTGPLPPAGDPKYMVIAKDDLVIVLQKRFQADPMKPGEFYDSFWFHMWRLKDNKLYEHWDAETIPSEIPDLLKGPVRK